MDGRLKEVNHPIRCDRLHTKKRELIYDFLTYIYLKHSEPMPEVTADSRMQSNAVLRFRKFGESVPNGKRSATTSCLNLQ